MAEEKIFSILAYKKGAVIVKEGSPSTDCFYIVHSGIVRLSCRIDIVKGKTSVLLGPGNFFSVISALSSKSNFENAVADSDVNIISVHKSKMEDFIREYSTNALKIIHYLSSRVRFLDEIVAHTLQAPPVIPPLSRIFEIAEYYAAQKRFKIAYYAYQRYVDYCKDGAQVKQALSMVKKLVKHGADVRFDYSKRGMYRFYPKDTMIFAEAEPVKELFVIKEGRVQITKIADGKENVLAILHKGDIMGEMALIEELPRSANAIALDDCDVIAIEQDDFPQLLNGNPLVAVKIATSLAERVWNTHEQIIKSGFLQRDQQRDPMAQAAPKG
jgi:CRP-like cAMP-binding protein